MDRAIVALVGGGAFVPSLCEALAREPRLPPLELRLAARDPAKLAVIAGHAARRVLALRPDFRVTPVASIDAAVDGARAVVLLIRVGGHAARDHDERFPLRFGLVGDEGLGPGGVANAFRTVPVLAEIAAALRARAPGAVVVNLVAPLGITTRLLLDAGLDAIGVCELPLVTLEAIAAAVSAAPGEVDFHYAGLNHLGWFWDVRAGGRDALGAAARAGLVDAEVLARCGAAPLHYYYDVFEPEAARRLGRTRTPGRARQLEGLSARLVARFAAAAGETAAELIERPTPWFDRAVVPALAARMAGVPHRGFANLQNGGLVPALPPELIVEVAADLCADGVHGRAPGPMPEAVARFLAAVGRAEDLAYRAAVERSPALVAEAIRALPLPIAAGDVPALTRLACMGVSDRSA